jgi:predicted DNA-binding WGR domain protein
MRRFEFVGGGADKFWEISVKGKEVQVHFGRNDTHGQREVKRFADEAKANKHAEKKIAEKIRKGYTEVN